MHNRIKEFHPLGRVGRAMSAAVLSASGLVTACSEQATSPIRPSVPIAATTTGTIRVVAQPAFLYVFHGDVTGEGDGGHVAWRRPRNILVERHAQPTAEANWAAVASAEANRVAGDVTSRQLHFKDPNGRLISIAIVDGANARHPTAAYQFIDGRIQVIASFTYDVAGRPKQMVYTLFGDDGTAKIQMTQSFSVQRSASLTNVFRRRTKGAELARRLATVIGSTLLPAQLSAESGGCAMADATVSLAATLSGGIVCAVSTACAPAGGTFLSGLVGAMSDWAGVLMTC